MWGRALFTYLKNTKRDAVRAPVTAPPPIMVPMTIPIIMPISPYFFPSPIPANMGLNPQIATSNMKSVIMYSYVQRHGSADGALCAPYAGTDCWGSFLISFVVTSAMPPIVVSPIDAENSFSACDRLIHTIDITHGSGLSNARLANASAMLSRQLTEPMPRIASMTYCRMFL